MLTFKTYLFMASLILAVSGAEYGEKMSPLQAMGLDLQQLKEMCQIAGGPSVASFDYLKRALQDFERCYDDLASQYESANSIDFAANLKMYCSAYMGIEKCVNPLLQALEPCLTEEMKEVLHPMKDTFYQLIDFVCVKEINRITQFIADGGIECFKNRNPAVTNCMNRAPFGRIVTPQRFRLQHSSLFKECNKLVPLRECVVGAVRTCPQPASTFIVNSVTNIVLRNTPCKDLADGAAAAGGALALLVGGAALALLL